MLSTAKSSIEKAGEEFRLSILRARAQDAKSIPVKQNKLFAPRPSQQMQTL